MIIYNYDDELIRGKSDTFNGERAAFSVHHNLQLEEIRIGCYLELERIKYFNRIDNYDASIMNTSDIQIRGMHNVYNSLASITAAKAFEIENEVIVDTLKNFSGVEHRIEFVKEINGVKYYNDSKATNVDSLTVALESFDKNIILIMGGEEAENDFEHIKDLIFKRVKNIIAIGESKQLLKQALSRVVGVEIAESLEEAVRTASNKGSEGDVVLFSPAYKSFDMFDNFEHRGKEFKKIVNQLEQNQ